MSGVFSDCSKALASGRARVVADGVVEPIMEIHRHVQGHQLAVVVKETIRDLYAQLSAEQVAHRLPTIIRKDDMQRDFDFIDEAAARRDWTHIFSVTLPLLGEYADGLMMRREVSLSEVERELKKSILGVPIWHTGMFCIRDDDPIVVNYPPFLRPLWSTCLALTVKRRSITRDMVGFYQEDNPSLGSYTFSPERVSDTGWLRPQTVRVVRTLLHGMKKIEFPSTVKQMEDAVNSYLDTEDSVAGLDFQ